MINFIVGPKGSGKTKKLIKLVNEAADVSLGNVVCIEKTPNLTGNISRKVRLIEAEDFDIDNCDKLEGFIKGMIASNYDITDIFVDQTLKIVGNSSDRTSELLKKIKSLSEEYNVNICLSLSIPSIDMENML